jgi:secreted trypsin-like serine protease
MLLNKVLFVSLLVLGLFYLQPAQCENRLNTRVAGGFKAVPGQFPFVVLITYLYTDTASGVQLTYQGTGVIYSQFRVLTSANAVSKCAAGTTLSVSQGVTDLNNPAGALVFQVVCGATTVVSAPGFTAGNYFGDVAYIDISTVTTTGFNQAGQVIRLPTSSPTASDINKLFVAGYGETFPGASPSPQLTYTPINPMRNNLCQSLLNRKASLVGKFSLAENFCVQGQINDPRTSGLSDACVLDAGAPLIRTVNISNPLPDFEVVGFVNFGTCTATVPVISTYIFKYLTFLGAQALAPAAGNPANPRAFDGNFACGDGIIQAGTLEKCDPASARTDPKWCCDIWTCQFKKGKNIACSTTNNGTKCKTRPICDVNGICKARDKNKKPCGSAKTGTRGNRCINGKCCKPGKPPTACF